MCGITGVLFFDCERRIDPTVIKKMTDSISHRGPDGEGYYIHDNLGLGHRRLSIIDLSTGEQPMFNVDKSLVLIFNGEIYNYIELRDELKKYGHTFQTNSDTEVIIKAYEQWGIDCQTKFNGMWAFALWDVNKRQLLLSRDRIGEKPLHYAVSDETLIFGSEIKSILAYGLDKVLNTDFLEIYLSLGYIPAPFTFFKNIHKLKAGHCLVINGNNIQERQYWELPELDEAHMLTDKNDVLTQFAALFKDSIKIRMRSDVPYGAFLSGGLDSSCIVASMSEISSFPIETFTIGFTNPAFDERDLARQVSVKFRTSHHEQVIEPDSFEESLNKIAHHYDEPFGDSSAIPTGLVSKFAATKVKMVLTGDGGDEVLSGYPSYQHEKFASTYQNLPGLLRKYFPSVLSMLPRPKSASLNYKLERARIVSFSCNMDFEKRFLYKDTCIDLPIIKQMTKNERVYPIEQFLSDFMKKCMYSDSFYKLMYLNLKLTLPNDMLVKVDRMSMAYSLEARSPFLDHRLIELMVNVDKDVKMHHYERKTILRKTIGKNLPAPLLNARKKGFSVPLYEWFKHDSFKNSVNSLRTKLPFLDEDSILEVIELNNKGEKNFGNFIWMLFALSKALPVSASP